MTTEKLSGIEMMLNSLMRAAGFNPKEVVGQMSTVVKSMQDGLQSVVETLERIESEQKRQAVVMAAIQRDLHIIKCAGGILDTPAVPLLANGHIQENEQ